MLKMEEFEEDLQAELSTAYPNYMTVLQTAKDDLLRKDCSIVIIGETNAGKSTLLNTLVGRKIFPVSNVVATRKVCRVRHSETHCVKTYDREENLITDERVDSELMLTEVIKKYIDTSCTSAEMRNIHYVDVHNPVDILKAGYLFQPLQVVKCCNWTELRINLILNHEGNIIIVDTPGIGETDELDQMLIDFLPSAVSMIIMVNASSGGGIQKGRLLTIFHEVIKNLDKMPCFDPRQVIFLTNKWDIIETEDTIGVNEHEKTWNNIIEKLKTEWTYLKEENVFKVSLKQGKSGTRIFTNELKRFEVLLQETIQRSQNKRIKHHFSFLEDFTQNAERGTLARLQLVGISSSQQQDIILANTGRIQVLTQILKDRRAYFETDNKEKTTQLTNKLYEYLNSEKTKEQIMNPEDDIAIASVGITSLKAKLNARFEKAIKDWLDGDEMKTIVGEVDVEMKNLLREVESKLNEIKTDMIGIKTPLRAIDIFDNFMSESVTIVSGVSGISFMETLVSVYTRKLLSLLSIGNDKNERMADKLFRNVLKTLSRDRIRECFKKSFSMEYDKKIKKIFDIKLKQKVDTLKQTNEVLNRKQKTIRQKQHSYECLHTVIKKIEKDSNDFIATISSKQILN
ncbi:unnamed protein product [Mytilus coruscus]|uniref:Dynamin N-terminal domain-containing protein n=1 Tax=Mytilus coruscus TaxID=42192 RepID=A0A6J8AXA4_MYTCO|nr:unnamed protein product [Mytilus coruscus]